LSSFGASNQLPIELMAAWVSSDIVVFLYTQHLYEVSNCCVTEFRWRAMARVDVAIQPANVISLLFA
jgi:hypothetical protein